jgi:hypothetical protein
MLGSTASHPRSTTTAVRTANVNLYFIRGFLCDGRLHTSCSKHVLTLSTQAWVLTKNSKSTELGVSSYQELKIYWVFTKYHILTNNTELTEVPEDTYYQCQSSVKTICILQPLTKIIHFQSLITSSVIDSTQTNRNLRAVYIGSCTKCRYRCYMLISHRSKSGSRI